jgi:hypothetical protein
MSNTIPKPSPAQQRVIDRLKAGETLSFLHGWRWNTDDEWGQAERTTTLNVLIEAALVVLDRKPIDPGIDGLPTRHEAVSARGRDRPPICHL